MSTLPAWATAAQPTKTKQIVCVGDSITEGFGLPTPATDCWCQQMVTNSNIGPEFGNPINTGVTGKQLSAMLTDVALYPESSYDAYTRNICVIFGGTNDGADGVAEATVIANLWSFCDAVRAKGWLVVVINCLPRIPVSVSQPTFDAWRASYNADIAAGWASHADALADVAANTHIGPDNAQNDLTYYQAGGVHPNVTGAGIIASIVGPAIVGLP